MSTDFGALVIASVCTIFLGTALSHFSGKGIFIGFSAGLAASIVGCIIIIGINYIFNDVKEKKLIIEDTNENSRR